MTKKKIKLLAIVGIFLLCFLFHFLYEWFPNRLFSIFFPVNESIWEHMKLLFSATLFYGIIDYMLLFRAKAVHNFFLQLFLSALLSIPLFLAIYLPFYYKIGAPMWLNLFILFVSICLSQLISYWILCWKPKRRIWDIASILGIIVVYVVFGILTYHPLQTELFFDPLEEKYGIHTYLIR